MAFAKPGRAERIMLVRHIRAFTAIWQVDSDSFAISESWLDYCAKHGELRRCRLDWLGFCILGGFNSDSRGRREIRKDIIRFMKQCLK